MHCPSARVLADINDRRNEVLRLAAAAEQPSEHPLARLLVAEARRRGLALPEIDDFQAQPGAGVRGPAEAPGGPGERGPTRQAFWWATSGWFANRAWRSLPSSSKRSRPSTSRGRPRLIVVCDGQVLGVIGARDRVRRAAHDVIHDLKHLGLKDLAILTGDRAAPRVPWRRRSTSSRSSPSSRRPRKAEWIEQRVMTGGSWPWWATASTTPRRWRGRTSGSPLPASAATWPPRPARSCSWATRSPRSPETIRLARQTVHIIRQNILFFAFGFNAIAVALAGLRVMGPVAAAIVHQIGSLLVLLNAIRLLGFERWHTYRFVRAGAQVAVGVPPVPAVDLARPRLGTPAIGHSCGHRGGGARLSRVRNHCDRAGPGGFIRSDSAGFSRPLLGPGLHLRWPAPFESVIVVEPDRSRLARIGLPVQPATAVKPVEWNATHGAKRDESALFFTGDENLVELAGVVEYRFDKEALAELALPGGRRGEHRQSSSRRSLSRGGRAHAAGGDPGQRPIANSRASLGQVLQERLQASGVRRAGRQGARGRCPSPPRGRAGLPRRFVGRIRRRTKPQPGPCRRRRSGTGRRSPTPRPSATPPQTRADRLVNRATGEKEAFLARASSHAAAPALTEFRLLWDTLATILPGRPKLILDRHAAGRRHVWLADPAQLGPALGRALAPLATEPVPRSPTIEQELRMNYASYSYEPLDRMSTLALVSALLASPARSGDRRSDRVGLRHRIWPARSLDRAAGPPLQVAPSERPRV